MNNISPQKFGTNLAQGGYVQQTWNDINPCQGRGTLVGNSDIEKGGNNSKETHRSVMVGIDLIKGSRFSNTHI